MRRWSRIAALVACLLISPAWGQMRGGRAGGAVARPGFAPRSPGRSFISQPRWGGGFHGGFRSGFHGGFHTGFHRRFSPHRSGFRSRRFVSYGYGWWPGLYGYPGYYGSYWYPDESYDASQDAYYQQNQQLQEEVANLSDEVERLRDEQQEARYAPPAPPTPSEAPTARPATPSQPTTLIFRNGQSQQVQNYAIAGQTLWIFGEQRAWRHPLLDLDIVATQKANEEQGIEFRVPRS